MAYQPTNNIFLSYKISQQYFQLWLISQTSLNEQGDCHRPGPHVRLSNGEKTEVGRNGFCDKKVLTCGIWVRSNFLVAGRSRPSFIMTVKDVFYPWHYLSKQEFFNPKIHFSPKSSQHSAWSIRLHVPPPNFYPLHSIWPRAPRFRPCPLLIRVVCIEVGFL